jgi:hypothetical protein
MQSTVSVERTSAARLCEHILGLDSSILFASICNMSGDEIASAAKPSVPLMVGSLPQMRETYIAGANAVVNVFKQGQPLFGELTDVVASYKNMKVLIVNLGDQNNAVAVLVATKDLDSKNATYRISKVTRSFV